MVMNVYYLYSRNKKYLICLVVYSKFLGLIFIVLLFVCYSINEMKFLFKILNDVINN